MVFILSFGFGENAKPWLAIQGHFLPRIPGAVLSGMSKRM
jgi:hypothetical protein